MIQIPDDIEFTHIISAYTRSWGNTNGHFSVSPYDDRQIQLRANSAISLSYATIRVYYI